MRYALLLVAACGGGSGSGDGGDDTGGADAPRPTHAGFLGIQSYDAMNTPGTPTRGGTATAGFWAAGGFCTTMQTIGACDVARCLTSAPAQVSGGGVTISGAAQPIMLTPGAMDQYAPFMITSPLFAGGEMITFTTAGAVVPSFTKTIKTPTKATITQPARPSMTSPYLVVNRTQDFTVSWSGGGSGKVQVALNSQQADQRVFCRFDASAGSGKVPSAVLSTLAPGQGGYAMAAITLEEAIAGDWAIEVSAYFNAVWPDNSIVSGPTMFQ
jgi:hypothetical protein